MTNHPNRRRGRPPIAPEDCKRGYSLRLPPALHDAAMAAGRERVEAVLAAALL